MPWTAKQHKFFQAVAHGMKPRSSDLTQAEAKKLAAEGVKGGKAKKKGK